MNCKILIAAAALLATQSFAIIGIGAHYNPGFGTTLKAGEKGPVSDGISFSHEGADGMMQGFGFKLWVDLLPIIDIEGTFNVRFGSYDASLYVKNPVDQSETEIPLEIELGGTPFGMANPKFVTMNGDISITYPITTLPIIRPYIGGGLTYYMNTFILNQPFPSKVVGGTYNVVKAELEAEMQNAIDGVMNNPAAALDPNSIALPDQNAMAQRLTDALVENIQDAALEEGLKTSIGGHILVGLRAKLPIIPIAAYANFKYYFGGDFPEEITPGRMAAEVGVGLAI